MENQYNIREFIEADAAQVRDLFIKTNRQIAPEELKDAFEDYISLSLREEIDRIPEYYREKKGSYWIVALGEKVVGMFGLEQLNSDAMELRRMYIDSSFRRRGLGKKALNFAEDLCRANKVTQLDLSTSETQQEALSMYRASGFKLMREEIASSASNKTVDGGIRRYYFTKPL